MTFKPSIWRPIAFGVSALNMVGVGLAAGGAESWHAGIHAVLALAFWTWGQRLREPDSPALGAGQLETLELEVSQLRRELADAQERLDFTERMLAQGVEARRGGAER
jgi:hypothetical protein